MKEMTVLFLKRDSEVLLAMKKRGFGAGRWNGVGGKVENGETVEEAVRRECLEEIEVAVLGFHKVAELTFDELHTGKREGITAHVFLGDTWEGEPVETEEMAPRWFPIDRIPLEEMWSDDVYWLPDVLNGRLLKGEFELDENDQVTRHNVESVEVL